MARRRLPKILSAWEVEQLLSVAVTDLQRILLLVGLFLGLRVSELCRLRVEDIDLDGRLVMVQQGKGSKDRNLPLPARLEAPLRTWLAGRRLGWAFPSPRFYGHHLSPRFVQLTIRRLAALAGLSKRVTPHLMRHTYATNLLHKGADIREVQELLGHADVSTTMVYTSVLPDRLRSAVDRL